MMLKNLPAQQLSSSGLQRELDDRLWSQGTRTYSALSQGTLLCQLSLSQPLPAVTLKE